ncbi:GspH/FimT family pseudopilin [Methylobacillus sp.]|uniref:GspH/FimT family pseudopilin n=1 Tax=Methylobacillus sp. TaxID=56818 RepID=UPI00257FE4C8|nr:GspH/FimT family pseudopilin [Methylobacillus sp.]
MLDYQKRWDLLMSVGCRNIQGYSHGFTLIELMIVIALLSILTVLAMTGFNTWVSNTKVRSVAEAIQNGLRLAQSEAVKRGRQVTFILTDSQPGLDPPPSTSGKNWSIQTVPLLSDSSDNKVFIQGATFAGAGQGVTISASNDSVTFSSYGRLVGLNNLVRYEVTSANADRPLVVQVSLGGKIRMCDPAKTLSATNPDGC